MEQTEVIFADNMNIFTKKLMRCLEIVDKKPNQNKYEDKYRSTKSIIKLRENV